MQDYKAILSNNKTKIVDIIKTISEGNKSEASIQKYLFRNSPLKTGPLSKSVLLLAYKQLKKTGELKLNPVDEKKFLHSMQMKAVRTQSGVTPVTVLMKPFPCPGKCIFCPNDIRMPKSYMSKEPGAQRAYSNKFDPYYQTYNRLVAFKNTGHTTDKIELIILGGTWSCYPESYQIYFVKRCFDAMNDFGKKINPVFKNPNKLQMPFNEDKIISNSDILYNQTISKNRILMKDSASWSELKESQLRNETAGCRCVGMVVETRPDYVNEKELQTIRKFGVTKIQIGVQALDSSILKKNSRGNNVKSIFNSIDLIRRAGFKIHIHWMPNLFGSSLIKDKMDYRKLFVSMHVKPDEIKIYPCSLVESTKLLDYYKKGLWKPYSYKELLLLVQDYLSVTPRYCRISRIERDFSSQDVIAGNKITNIRQTAEINLEKEGIEINEIRYREIKNMKVALQDLFQKETIYDTAVSKEIFFEFVTLGNKIAGFLRLTLPKRASFIKELEKNAIIREVHVYGQSLEIHQRQSDKAQHMGLGNKLIQQAETTAHKYGYKKISVISSIGTRQYYKKLGYKLGNLYQYKLLTT